MSCESKKDSTTGNEGSVFRSPISRNENIENNENNENIEKI